MTARATHEKAASVIEDQIADQIADQIEDQIKANIEDQNRKIRPDMP